MVLSHYQNVVESIAYNWWCMARLDPTDGHTCLYACTLISIQTNQSQLAHLISVKILFSKIGLVWSNFGGEIFWYIASKLYIILFLYSCKIFKHNCIMLLLKLLLLFLLPSLFLKQSLCHVRSFIRTYFSDFESFDNVLLYLNNKNSVGSDLSDGLRALKPFLHLVKVIGSNN